MNQKLILVAISLITVILGVASPVYAKGTENMITRLRTNGYHSFEWYHQDGDTVFPDVYFFEIPNIYHETGVGGGQVIPLTDNYSYGFVAEAYLVSGSTGEAWLEPALLIWGSEEKWGFNVNIFQYIALNGQANTYTFLDPRVFLGDKKFKAGMSLTGMLDEHNFSEDHGPFVEFGTEIGAIRLTYKADELEVALTTSF